MASEKVVVLSYFGAWLGGLVLTAGAFWLTRSLASRTRIRALVVVASFAPSFIILKFNGVVSAPELVVISSTLFVYALFVGAALFVLIWAAFSFWRPKERQH